MLGWVGPSRTRLGPGQAVFFYFLRPILGRGAFEAQGSGVRERAGVERISQRSLEYKPLPHAPRTAV